MKRSYVAGLSALADAAAVAGGAALRSLQLS